MSNITRNSPSFVFGYWRPWKENSSFADRYFDYVRDVSLSKYMASSVGEYINQASEEQIYAIEKLGEDIGIGMSLLSNQMTEISDRLNFLNKNLDIQIEQQKLSNLLLENIAQLLRVPDSEKERQHSIELGVKFFVNASKDPDLYTDALAELLKAESLMKQDYFVLHRIGSIYLHVEKHLDPEKALDYFARAAKYASVESDERAVGLVNVLTQNFNTVNSAIHSSKEKIALLAAESFEKAAFAAYVLGRFEDAANYQNKALKLNETPQNKFFLAKYQVRSGKVNDAIENLEKAIDAEPLMALASFKEIDLINEPEVINLISRKNGEIDDKIKKLLDILKTSRTVEAGDMANKLTELLNSRYDVKATECYKHEKFLHEVETGVIKTENQIDNLIEQIEATTLNTDKNSLIRELKEAREKPIEEMTLVVDKVIQEFEKGKLKIGSVYGGGNVFYLDKTGNHGLVMTSRGCKDIYWCGNTHWDGPRPHGRGIANGEGQKNTKILYEFGSTKTITKKGFFKTTTIIEPVMTAARLCVESNDEGYEGYNDWYLPTIDELKQMYEVHYKMVNEYVPIIIDRFIGLEKFEEEMDRCFSKDKAKERIRKFRKATPCEKLEFFGVKYKVEEAIDKHKLWNEGSGEFNRNILLNRKLLFLCSYGYGKLISSTEGYGYRGVLGLNGYGEEETFSYEKYYSEIKMVRAF